MNSDDRDRILRLELRLEQVMAELRELRADVKQFRLLSAKASGAILALTTLGVGIGWVLSNVKNWIGISS